MYIFNIVDVDALGKVNVLIWEDITEGVSGFKFNTTAYHLCEGNYDKLENLKDQIMWENELQKFLVYHDGIFYATNKNAYGGDFKEDGIIKELLDNGISIYDAIEIWDLL